MIRKLAPSEQHAATINAIIDGLSEAQSQTIAAGGQLNLETGPSGFHLFPDREFIEVVKVNSNVTSSELLDASIQFYDFLASTWTDTEDVWLLPLGTANGSAGQRFLAIEYHQPHNASRRVFVPINPGLIVSETDGTPNLANRTSLIFNEDDGFSVSEPTPASEVQTITIDATGGTFTITFDGQTTAALAWNASAATVQAALEGLSTIGAGNISVSLIGLVYTCTFQGDLAQKAVSQMTTNATLLTGGAHTATMATTVPGVAPATARIDWTNPGGGGSGYLTIQEEGTPLTQRDTLNFIGSAITAADDAGNTRTNITLSQLPATSTSVVGTERTVSAGTGLSGGGDLSANRSFALANTAVTPGSYGSGTSVGTFTVDAQGRLTAAGNAAISFWYLTAEADGGSPSYTGTTKLIFDYADGFVLSQPAANQVRIDISAATYSQAGIVSTTTQTFQGDKTFRGDVKVIDSGGVQSDCLILHGASSSVNYLGGTDATDFWRVGMWNGTVDFGVFNGAEDYGVVLQISLQAGSPGLLLDYPTNVAFPVSGSNEKLHYSITKDTDGSRLVGVWATDAIGNVFSGGIATTVSATLPDNIVTTSKIADSAVTYPKLPDISSPPKLLGRYSSGTGDTEAATIGTALKLGTDGILRGYASKRWSFVADEVCNRSGSWGMSHDAAQNYGFYVSNSPANDGEWIEFGAFLKAGTTYRLVVLGITTSSSGKVDWSIDGTNVVSGQDWYSASGTYNVFQTADNLTVTGDGYHLVRATLNGKNGSSSGYGFLFTKGYLLVYSGDAADNNG